MYPLTQLGGSKSLNYIQLQYSSNQNLLNLSCKYQGLQLIYLDPISLTSNVFNCREMSRRTTEEQAKKIYDRALRLEQEFGEYFTGELSQFMDLISWLIDLLLFSAVVQGDTIEDIYSKVKNIVWAQSGPTIWVPSTENLWPTYTWTFPPRARCRPVSRTGQHQ